MSANNPVEGRNEDANAAPRPPPQPPAIGLTTRLTFSITGAVPRIMGIVVNNVANGVNNHGVVPDGPGECALETWRARERESYRLSRNNVLSVDHTTLLTHL